MKIATDTMENESCGTSEVCITGACEKRTGGNAKSTGGNGKPMVEMAIRPVETGNLPVEMTIRPVEMRNLPVEMTNLPVETGNLPVEMGNLPVEMRNLPVEMTIRPVEMRNQPVEWGGYLYTSNKFKAAAANQRSTEAACFFQPTIYFFLLVFLKGILAGRLIYL